MVSFSSERLSAGAVYTRKDLKALFGIKDASLNNGVFRPAGQNSVWLFVTESKTPDRTQYVDHLDGDVLHMEGQTQGRTDPNGILLRADIHTLFDLGDIWIEPDTYVVRTATTLAESEYAGFDGVSLRLPSDTTEHPSREALRARLVALEY